MGTADRSPGDIAHEILLARHPEVREQYERMRPRYEAIAELIRLRKEAGLTQAELAERLGRPQSVVSEIESGRRSPRVDTLAAAARVLGYDLRIELAPRAGDVDADRDGDTDAHTRARARSAPARRAVRREGGRG